MDNVEEKTNLLYDAIHASINAGSCMFKVLDCLELGLDHATELHLQAAEEQFRELSTKLQLLRNLKPPAPHVPTEQNWGQQDNSFAMREL